MLFPEVVKRLKCTSDERTAEEKNMKRLKVPKKTTKNRKERGKEVRTLGSRVVT